MNKSKKRNKNSSTLLHGKVGKQFFVESAAIIRLLLLFGKKKIVLLPFPFDASALAALSRPHILYVCVCVKKRFHSVRG